MRLLEDKVAVITGAAGIGIGQATARALAREGALIVVSDAHAKRPFAVAEDIKTTFGVKTMGIQCDVSNRSQVRNMVSQTIKRFGKIDILVNNAGRGGVFPVWEMPDETWDMIIGVNLNGTFNCTKAILPKMIEQRSGVIINLSSIAAHMCSPHDGVAYCSSKAAIEAFTKVVAQEVGQYNIRVNAIAPSVIWNKFMERVPGLSPEYLQSYKDQTPLRRFGTPEEVAEAIVYLASDKASYISGAVLDMTGGFHPR